MWVTRGKDSCRSKNSTTRLQFMKVLVTGSTGMLGSAILRVLSPTENVLLYPGRQTLNLEDVSATDRFIELNRPDLVIHCAAKVGGISANIENPSEFLTKNLIMDHSLLEASKRNGVENLIYIASSCMYPRNLPHAMKEAEILSGSLEATNEGYALAKIVGWKTVQMMSVSHNWRTLVLSNLYGPGDHFDSGRSHLIAAIIDKVAKAKKLKLDTLEMWGDGTARREFTYVEDIAIFIKNSMRQLQDFPDTLNLGSGIDYSVRDYYELVCKVMSYRGTIVPNHLKPTGMERKLMDVSKARALGWAPTTSIEDGIVKTIKWYESDSMKGFR